MGHLAPGFALAQALERRGARALFLTPGEAVEADWFPAPGPARATVPAPRRPRGLREALPFLPRLGRSVALALRLVRRERPRALVALGGWPCVPGAAAALLAGVPLALITSDAQPGLVVRLLAPLARRVYAAQEAARARLARGRAPAATPRLRWTGPIVRPEVPEARRDPAALGLDPALPTLFVVGGSLGARGLNDAVVAGLRAALASEPSLAGRLQVLHATGRQGGEGVAEAYAALGLRHVVRPFVREVGNALQSAALVLSRAGALTCAELEATGAAAVLVPYPHHEDRQQFQNAEPLVARGAALLVEEAALTPEAVRRTVLTLLLDPERLAAMRAAMRRGYRDAASAVADDLLALHRPDGARS